MPTLIYRNKHITPTTPLRVEPGDIVDIRRNPTDEPNEVIVRSIQEPHKPASTGRVYVSHKGSDGLFTKAETSYFPGVIDAEWIGRTDQD